MIYQSQEPDPEEIEVHKHQIYTSYLSSETVETGFTGETRVNVTPGNAFQRRRKILNP